MEERVNNIENPEELQSEEIVYTVENPEELQGEEITQTGKKSSKVKTVVITALVTAALLLGGGQLIDYIQSNEAEVVVQAEESEFNINDKDEIITRGTDLSLDLRTAGYEISGEDALYFMLFAGNDDLNEDFIRQLNLSDTTERTITDSVDKTLIDVKEAIMGGQEVSIPNYFPKAEDQALLANLINIMSHWDTADKQKVADAMLELNEYMFIKGQYQEYSPQAVVTYIKLFRGFDELTINSGYTLATDDMRNLIYIDQDCYTVDGDITGRSIHSEQYAVVKEILGEKFNGREYEKPYALGLGYQIVTEIDDRIKTSGIELGTKTDVQAERDKNSSVIYADDPKSDEYAPPISKTEKEQIVTDPTTGDEYISQPATETEKEEQRQEVNEQIKEEGKQEAEVTAKEIQTQWQLGHDAGFTDGVEGNAKASMDSQTEHYVKGYEYGYGLGYEMYTKSLEDDTLISETYVPVNEEEVVQTSTTSGSQGSSATTPESTTTSSFQFVNGFYESNGIIYDSEGYMITDENGRPLTIPGVNSDDQKTR